MANEQDVKKSDLYLFHMVGLRRLKELHASTEKGTIKPRDVESYKVSIYEAFKESGVAVPIEAIEEMLSKHLDWIEELYEAHGYDGAMGEIANALLPATENF